MDEERLRFLGVLDALGVHEGDVDGLRKVVAPRRRPALRRHDPRPHR